MSDWETRKGYSGAAFDLQVGRSEKSPLEKVKEQFWTAKQVVRQKLGKKEDDHLTASDAELDAKLELFNSIKMSSGGLMRIANRYQREMHELSKEEYAMGQFLKRHGEQDSSRAGIMLTNVAKAFVISAQKRMEARSPLIRLAQDARTYRRCAVSDSERKIEQMQESRTEYRGALLWMKNVSEELDPDTFKQLEKFRKVQGQVRMKKERFDSHKLDTLQKIDLLAISRLNMLSQSLSPYGSAVHDFYEKMASVLASVAAPVFSHQEAELGILKQHPTEASGSSLVESPVVEDASLLDLTGDIPSSAPIASSSYELIDAFWKESGLEHNNFDPLVPTLDGLSMDSGDVQDKKDSPDTQPGTNLFDFSELDESEKGSMNFLSGDVPLQPTKLSPVEKSGSKEGTVGGLRSFLPSQLLKRGWNHASSLSGAPSRTDVTGKDVKTKDKLSSANPAWLNLFSDLDPLSAQSPEPVKRTDGKDEEGNC